MNKKIVLLCFLGYMTFGNCEDYPRAPLFNGEHFEKDARKSIILTQLELIQIELDEWEPFIEECKIIDEVNFSAVAIQNGLLMLGATYIRKYKKLRAMGLIIPAAHLGLLGFNKLFYSLIYERVDELKNVKRKLEWELRKLC